MELYNGSAFYAVVLLAEAASLLMRFDSAILDLSIVCSVDWDYRCTALVVSCVGDCVVILICCKCSSKIVYLFDVG